MAGLPVNHHSGSAVPPLGDQDIDKVDFKNLNARLRANSAQEKIANAWLDRLLAKAPDVRRV